MIGRELSVYEPFSYNCSTHFADTSPHLDTTALPPSDSVALLFSAIIISYTIGMLFFVLFIFVHATVVQR